MNHANQAQSRAVGMSLSYAEPTPASQPMSAMEGVIFELGAVIVANDEVIKNLCDRLAAVRVPVVRDSVGEDAPSPGRAPLDSKLWEYIKRIQGQNLQLSELVASLIL